MAVSKKRKPSVSKWKPLPEDVVAYETAVESAAKLRLAHSLLTDVISDLRNVPNDREFDMLLILPRAVDKAQSKMVELYRELRRKDEPEPEPKPVLTPTDSKRCQADVPGNGPFTLGGEIGDPKNGYRTRCKNRPTWVATEKKPGPDGLKGSMALCDLCKSMMEQQMPGDCSFGRLSKEKKES